jgi:DNA-binding transcriptional MerR regulator
MKIKDVCSATGLTDKAIRFYISKGLVTPSFTENYNGRKSYDFSNDDVKVFSDISTLRKAGFSVDEIKSIIQSPDNSKKIINSLINRKNEEINNNLAVVSALEGLVPYSDFSLSGIAETLKRNTENIKQPDNNINIKFKSFLIWLANNAFRIALLIGCSAILFYTIVFFFANKLSINVTAPGIVYLIIKTIILLIPIIYALWKMISEGYVMYIQYSLIEIIVKTIMIALFLLFYYFFAVFTIWLATLL